MNQEFEIHVEGLEELLVKFHTAPSMIGRDLSQGMEVALDTVLGHRGLRKYPPRTAANQPPPPYYRRGRGVVRRSGRLDPTSERLGTQFYTKVVGTGSSIFGVATQRASYGQFVVGDKQPHHMHQKGWRKMKDEFRGSSREMANILEAFVSRALWKLGLIDEITDVFS